MISFPATVNYENRWCLAEIDHNLGRYLRRLLLNGCGLKLERPCRSEHITIVSEYDNNKLYYPDEWFYRDKEVIEVFMHMDLYTNGNAFWYTVWSRDLYDIRTKLGYGPPTIPLHFCIGYRHQGVCDVQL